MDAYVPYRAILPKGLDGIMSTGLGISAHSNAMPVIRMQPDIQNQGYAAGRAAAMAAADNVATRDIDLEALQRHLVEIDCLPDSVLTDKDSFPVPAERVAEAVDSLVKDWEGLGIVLAQETDALPHLRRACNQVEDPEHKLVYAHILGMLGDASGVEVLLKSVEAAEWDQGWDFKGGGQFGMSMSPLDSRIIALARTRDPRTLDTVVAKTAQLDTDSEFSHHRAVAMALETLADPRGAKPLADLLGKPGLTGHAYTNIDAATKGASTGNPDLERDRSLRELILARALFRCGDYEGLGERILREYAQDLRGHHARHANAVLREKAGR
ncbi:MAG: FAD-dependent oxidoreductase [bacterium]|nr:FAD-dependent oxidoreductase [bacterium]